VPGFDRLKRSGTAAAVAFTLAGLVLHFKRGAWLSAAAGLVVLAGVARRWKILLALGLAAAAVCALPWTQARLADLPLQWKAGQGTRADIWLKAAPGIFREHPWGLGYGGMQKSDVSSRVPQVEAKQDHLHSNLLQMRAELGWAGLVVWLGWMIATLAVAARAGSRLQRRGNPTAALAQGAFAALAALLFNGLAEYNFGTGLIRLLFVLLCGLIIALEREGRPLLEDRARNV
jgi:O-antigen ligase